MDSRRNVPQYFGVMSEDDWTMESVTTDLAALMGRRPEDMIGRDAWEFVKMPPEPMRPYFAGQLASGEDVSGIADLVHRNGGLIPYAYRLRRIEWEDGRCVIAQTGVPLSSHAVEGFDRLDAVVTRIESALAAALDNPYLTVKRAVEYTAMSEDKLREWAAANVIQRYGTARAVRYRQSELDNAMALEFGAE